MLYGKIVLNTAAVVVTAITAVTAKYNKGNHHRLYTQSFPPCKAVNCATLAVGTQIHACTLGPVTVFTDPGCNHRWTGLTTSTL